MAARRTEPTAPICRNVTVSGKRTSVRLEPVMWDCLMEICAREQRSLNEVCSEVDRGRRDGGLTAALRVHIIRYFRDATTASRPAAHRRARHGNGKATGADISPVVAEALQCLGT